MIDYISFSQLSSVMDQSIQAPFFCKLEEEYDNELYITIMGAKVDEDEIEPNPEQTFGIVFENYIMYQVRLLPRKKPNQLFPPKAQSSRLISRELL